MTKPCDDTAIFTLSVTLSNALTYLISVWTLVVVMPDSSLDSKEPLMISSDDRRAIRHSTPMKSTYVDTFNSEIFLRMTIGDIKRLKQQT